MRVGAQSPSNKHVTDHHQYKNSASDKRISLILVGIGLVAALIITTLILAAVTLANVVKQAEKTTTTTTEQSLNSELAESVKIDDVMMHLKELQEIATNSNGNRAANTAGFNRTVDYITNYLSTHTDFKVQTELFYYRNFLIEKLPSLTTSINGVLKNRSISDDLSMAEFYYVYHTRPISLTNSSSITVIPNLGCSESDWLLVSSAVRGGIVIVKRGECFLYEKAAFATKYGAAVVLFYNDGTSPDRVSPLFINLGEDNDLPALFLSYTLGAELVSALADPSNDVRLSIDISLTDDNVYPSNNICADTPTGDPTQTIVVGSHSDGALEGPGINDNGSGTAANLALAVGLARLLRKSSYSEFKYRVRFCWWGAEELGLFGSEFHVKKAKNATAVGERLQDYLINLNYDMLGSPNFIFGIYDGRTANDNTPAQALPGSTKMTSLYKEWFDQQRLPWSYTNFDGRSDYGPFLAEGTVAGGLFSGADGKKSKEERDRYDSMLGQGLGGIAGVIEDPCYHQPCDSIQNINKFALEKMVQAAAYVLEFLGRQDDLKNWLYPATDIQQLKSSAKPKYKYNSINEYFGLPYL